jgi:hypothetical protein
MKLTTGQLVIDKDVFQGSSTQSLCDFVQNHLLILSDDLYYECASTCRQQQELLGRFRDVILAGGCICPGRNKIIREEAVSLSPYGMLVDMQTISAVRKTFQRNGKPYKPEEVETVKVHELQIAQMIIDFADAFTNKLVSEEPKRLAEIRRCDSSKTGRSERLVQWAESVDTQDIHHASEEMLKGLTNRPDKFCLSEEWVSWHFLRLYLILLQERTFSRQTGDSSGQISLEHDLQDLNYVLLLSRVDGLLSRDKDLVIPIAKAAFPDKSVFSSLEEVPEEYLGDWSQG